MHQVLASIATKYLVLLVWFVVMVVSAMVYLAPMDLLYATLGVGPFVGTFVTVTLAVATASAAAALVWRWLNGFLRHGRTPLARLHMTEGPAQAILTKGR